MEKKFLKTFFEKKVEIKINLKNGKFYSGIILELSDHTLLFKDKYGSEIPFDYDSIAYVDLAREVIKHD